MNWFFFISKKRVLCLRQWQFEYCIVCILLLYESLNGRLWSQDIDYNVTEIKTSHFDLWITQQLIAAIQFVGSIPARIIYLYGL